jgi:homospermidine synthase
MTATSSGNGPLDARFDGPIVMVGFGSIGKGTLPLIERHIAFDRAKFVVIAPDDEAVPDGLSQLTSETC